MGRTVRLFEGHFGRLVLTELADNDPLEAQADPAIVLQHGEGQILFLNPGELQICLGPRTALLFHAATAWLQRGFPAIFRAQNPFPRRAEPMTARIRSLAGALAVEVVNDRFLLPERLEFMLQELVLSIVETYLAGRRLSVWRGSRFEDIRIRRALGLLRAHPNKDLSMDQLANCVGLSRSRFYDLFEMCTGFSPRTYLDMLCVEAAIFRLASGEGKISEVSAELGFSAQSNFTRFFQNQVGVPPSEYRRAASRGEQDAKPAT
jgi:AraC family transcriptional regulator